MYLEGAARKWFMCLAAPDTWRDVAAVVGPPTVPGVKGMRSVFLAAFQHENYGRYQETKVRGRKQGIEEAATEYYYDVIDLCQLVDPAMPEATKLDYLFRGLQPSLLEKNAIERSYSDLRLTVVGDSYREKRGLIDGSFKLTFWCCHKR